MNTKQNITLVEVVWCDNYTSYYYIKRLDEYLNPNNSTFITTPMWNKKILPHINNRVNHYSRFMVVFDYDENKPYQKCFSYSSPKDHDRKNDLTFFKLPTQTKLMLNSAIDIPTKYLSK